MDDDDNDDNVVVVAIVLLLLLQVVVVVVVGICIIVVVPVLQVQSLRLHVLFYSCVFLFYSTYNNGLRTTKESCCYY